MNLISPQFCPAVLSLMYVNTSSDPVIVDKLVARNNDTVAQLLKVYLVPTGEAAGDGNLFISKSLAASEVTKCEALVGAEVSPGYALWAIAATASKVSIFANGRARRT